MSYRRIMIFQRFSWNKLEKGKTKPRYCSKSCVTVANPGRTVPCKTGLGLGWTGSYVRRAKCLVSKFMDLFGTALQVKCPIWHSAASSSVHGAFYSFFYYMIVASWDSYIRQMETRRPPDDVCFYASTVSDASDVADGWTAVQCPSRCFGRHSQIVTVQGPSETGLPVR